jgi:thiol-disulfide isomerase/thioredoxin
MKRWFILLLALLLVACSAPASPMTAAPIEAALPEAGIVQGVAVPTEVAMNTSYPDLGVAPELVGDVWLNTDKPLRLADLRGKVVLVDMWTFGCINCRHVIPSLRGWYETYGAQGLVVIGNHFPEFSYEKDLNNLKKAISELNVPYPVVEDNQGVNWRAYNNRFWPTLYLIDKRGHLRYTHIGEGAYAETEAAIQALLAETAGG